MTVQGPCKLCQRRYLERRIMLRRKSEIVTSQNLLGSVTRGLTAIGERRSTLGWFIIPAHHLAEHRDIWITLLHWYLLNNLFDSSSEVDMSALEFLWPYSGSISKTHRRLISFNSQNSLWRYTNICKYFPRSNEWSLQRYYKATCSQSVCRYLIPCILVTHHKSTTVAVVLMVNRLNNFSNGQCYCVALQRTFAWRHMTHVNAFSTHTYEYVSSINTHLWLRHV